MALQPCKETCCCVGMLHMASNSKTSLSACLVALRLLLFICQQMEKEDYNFLALEWKRRSESNIQQNVTP